MSSASWTFLFLLWVLEEVVSAQAVVDEVFAVLVNALRAVSSSPERVAGEEKKALPSDQGQWG